MNETFVVFEPKRKPTPRKHKECLKIFLFLLVVFLVSMVAFLGWNQSNRLKTPTLSNHTVDRFAASLDYPTTPIAPDGVIAPVPVNPLFSAQFAGALSGAVGFPKNPVSACNDQNAWALTYDDGPSPSTPTVLAALRARGIKATFFVTGARSRLYPEILQQVVQDGHEIGIHTWAHIQLDQLSLEQVVSETMWTWNLVKDITGYSCKLFRPPLGVTNAAILSLLNGMGFTAVVNWNADSEDWRDEGASVQRLFASWTAESPHSGHISLEHDIRAGPVQAAHFGMDAS
ncbi:chitin deacetylase [Kappamyces sp. JEL0829]|nr:chitin deacetylase [Kappamyces sp. JEL0829]